MAKVPFKYYLHDDYESSERIEHIASQVGLSEDHRIFEDIGRPFYEVTLHCLLDTETGKVELVSAEL